MLGLALVVLSLIAAMVIVRPLVAWPAAPGQAPSTASSIAPLPADQVAGAHSWSGLLCDGTTATVNYDVALDGTVSNVVATPDTATVKAGELGVGAGRP